MNRIRSLSLWLGSVGLAASVVSCAQEIESSPDTDGTTERRTTLAAATPEERSDDLYQTHLYSERDADVYARLDEDELSGSGLPVVAIHVEIGDAVGAGRLLATLEDAEAKLAVEEARAEADAARVNFERIRELREREVVSPSEYDDALYENRRAQAALQRAELNLARTRVRAPFAGVVSRRYVRVGELVEERTPLFRITALAPLRARLLVPEARAGAFSLGATVRLTAADGTTGEAPVILIGPTVDPASGIREVIVELPEAGAFKPGAAVVAELVGEDVGIDR
ncbi:MAG: efflux RND transporter periplasmic adaptor subunit [Gemmatimonadota bacterium]